MLECGVPIFEAWQVPLIENSAFRDDNTLCEWIVESPTFVTFWIAKEYALLHVGTQGTSFILLDMDIGKRTKDTQV